MPVIFPGELAGKGLRVRPESGKILNRVPIRMQKTFLDYLRKKARLLALAMLLAIGFHASAEIIFGEYGRADEDEPPKEVKVMPLVLPEFPREENLLPFGGGPTETQDFFIDSTSLSVGE